MERAGSGAAAGGAASGRAEDGSPAGWQEEAVDRIAASILDNRLRPDGTEARYTPDEARRLAREVLRHFLEADPQDYPLILDAAGFKFVLDELSYYPGFDHDVLHVLLWTGSYWTTVEEVPLPPADRR